MVSNPDRFKQAEKALDGWYAALQARYMAEFEFAEVRRALEALSGLYVKRRNRLQTGHGLDSAGKRAAFGLFYGPLHFLQVCRVVLQTGLDSSGVKEIVDLGCGTGLSGIGWSFCRGGLVPVRGVDSNRWAVAEARWTYELTGVNGRAECGDMARLRFAGHGLGILAAFALNEISEESNGEMKRRLSAALNRGAVVLIIEPIAGWAAPWLGEWGDSWSRFSVRHDQWRFEVSLPEPLRLLDRAAGLDHRILTCQSLLVDPGKT